MSLAEVVRLLPDYYQSSKQATYLEAIENATIVDRDSALPHLLQWLNDQRPWVRGSALLSIRLLYLPSEKRPGTLGSIALPAQYVPAIAALLRDPDIGVRSTAFAALQPAEYSQAGRDELVRLVLPMLREPDVLTEYPNPMFIEGDKRMLAGMTPEQQAQFLARPRKVIRLPAEGPGLLSFLTMQGSQPSTPVDDAIMTFLDRDDQTGSTLGECLHILALGSASERVDNEVLRRVFKKKALTIFLLQFVANLRLNPAQLTLQRERLLALSNDEETHPALRRSAKDVAECWNAKRAGSCKPSGNDLSEQLDTR